MAIPVHVDIVSLERELFSGLVTIVTVPALLGALGAQYGHAPLLTKLLPGYVKIVRHEDQQQEFFYITGGMLEIQPKCVTILADSAKRGTELNEKLAVEIRERAKHILLGNKKESNVDYAQISLDLASAIAQLRVIQQIKKSNSV